MPNRIIKESICISETIDKLSWFEECFFYRLIVNCDDYGRFDARPAVLKARLFPLRERVTLKNVSDALTELAAAGCVVLYECDGHPYLQLPTWEVHQTIRAKKSRYPSFADGVKASASICMQIQEDVPVIQSNPNPNPNPKESACARFRPPSVADVKTYCLERKNSVDAETFVDFYASKGWKVGKEPMKDWKACVRTWEKRDEKPYPRGKPSKAMDYMQRDTSPDDSFVVDYFTDPEDARA